ncbi:hypothetical protein AWZ03_013942 [Drosophila navojoa]|uniref:Uncharacterized protein n=1 Tax=Drosophila navojoa TaxID=7232 RepID=A0A484AT74_DRONA|nr:uncharacterized protein LOC115565047 [Drosophila navojoa]TDG39636.1 hypothetical protein AWZ03_013942 [Drosophila navojoa]
MRWYLFFASVAFVSAIARDSTALDDAKSENLCELCFCSARTLRCDFRHNRTLSRIFDSKYYVPAHITSFYVDLAKNTEFEVHNGLFRQNRVNMLMIEGHNDSNQVELTANFLGGNQAGYPDVQIHGVGHSFLRPEAFSNGESKLNIEHNEYVVLYPNCFKNMNMSCTLTNIKNLEINENYNPSTDRSSNTKLIIVNSHINQLNRIDASINKISFTNCTIDHIQSNALDVTNVKQIQFDSSRIGTIEPMAIPSKLLSDSISFIGNQIGTIKSKAIMGSGTAVFSLSNNTIDQIMEDGMIVNCVDAVIVGNRFGHVEKNWIIMDNYWSLYMDGNHFENFPPIQLSGNHNRRTNCTFVNNFIKNPQPSSLNFDCAVRATSVDHSCGCDDLHQFMPTLTEHDIGAELYCKLPERLASCFKASQMHMRRYENEVCVRNQTALTCHDGTKLECHEDGCFTKEELEERRRGFPILAILAIAAAVGLPVLGAIFGIIWCCTCQKSKRKQYCSFTPEHREKLQQEIDRLPYKEKKKLKNIISSKNSVKQCHDLIIELLNLPTLSNDVEHILSNHLKNIHNAMRPTAPAVINNETNNVPLLYSLPSDTTESHVYAYPVNTANVFDDDMPPAYAAVDEVEYAVPHCLPLPPSQQQQQLPSTSNATYATPVLHPPIRKTPVVPPEVPQRQMWAPNQLISARNKSQQQPARHNNNSNNNNNNSSSNTRQQTFQYWDGAASLAAMEHMDMRGAAALPPDTNSDHSGGSDETVKIDDIAYADA